MRMELAETRLHSRGKNRSYADFRRLRYLTLISTRNKINPEEFFRSVVKAWKQHEATCHNLSIECRLRTPDHAVFLITNRRQIVAQVAIPKYLLKEARPLHAFNDVQPARQPRVPKVSGEPVPIGTLQSGMTRVTVEAEVRSIAKPRHVITRFGLSATVANASIADDTGRIQLPLWNQQIDAVSVGDYIHVKNARVITYRGERQLKVARGGQVRIINNGHPEDPRQPR